MRAAAGTNPAHAKASSIVATPELEGENFIAKDGQAWCRDCKKPAASEPKVLLVR